MSATTRALDEERYDRGRTLQLSGCLFAPRTALLPEYEQFSTSICRVDNTRISSLRVKHTRSLEWLLSELISSYCRFDSERRSHHNDLLASEGTTFVSLRHQDLLT